MKFQQLLKFSNLAVKFAVVSGKNIKGNEYLLSKRNIPAPVMGLVYDSAVFSSDFPDLSGVLLFPACQHPYTFPFIFLSLIHQELGHKILHKFEVLYAIVKCYTLLFVLSLSLFIAMGNDVWMFNTTNSTWVLIGGEPSNIDLIGYLYENGTGWPGNAGFSDYWVDGHGNIYLFSGEGVGMIFNFTSKCQILEKKASFFFEVVTELNQLKNIWPKCTFSSKNL